MLTKAGWVRGEHEPHGHVVNSSHRRLIDAQPQTALASRKHRAHDLLCLDHVPKQREIMHPPREPTAGAAICGAAAHLLPPNEYQEDGFSMIPSQDNQMLLPTCCPQWKLRNMPP